MELVSEECANLLGYCVCVTGVKTVETGETLTFHIS